MSEQVPEPGVVSCPCGRTWSGTPEFARQAFQAHRCRFYGGEPEPVRAVTLPTTVVLAVLLVVLLLACVLAGVAGGGGTS